jgi:signal transduction histidine kinase
VIPLLILTYIAIVGVQEIGDVFYKNSQEIVKSGDNLVKETADTAIKDSIKALDKTSQNSLEKLTKQLANSIADFLYERDKDILFLSNIDINKNTLKSFYDNKQRDIIINPEYKYDDKSNSWVTDKNIIIGQKESSANLKDNQKEFHHNPKKVFDKKYIPLYKEVTYFDLNGKEKIKISSIDKKLKNISNKKNTYIKAETYYNEIKNLKKGEIYVSDVIGKYVKSNIIGTYTKEKTQKMGIEFDPQNSAYAGKENPVGKRYEGIVRFVTPVYKNGKKKGYISLALDHRHIMEFTDYILPNNKLYSNISDASSGDYAFMWDYLGRNISHPRDYFISGYDENGDVVTPWVSKDIAQKYKESKISHMNEFLKTYPIYENQSLSKKPNISQIKRGELGLDCRYLNFAPQCEGWMQLVKNGGYGSFVIYWSKVWKLTTAAAIPYYTGKYKDRDIGFGYVTFGASVEEFHKAANDTKKNIDTLIKKQTDSMQEIIANSNNSIIDYIKKLINELNFTTVIMVILVIFIAIMMSDFITSQIQKLIKGSEKFANNELDYRIDVTSNDEIGQLSVAFNNMASAISTLINEQKKLNETLEDKVKQRTSELDRKNSELQKSLNELKKAQEQLIHTEKMAALGGLVAGIAHEVNTPLGVSVTASSHLANKTKEINQKFADGTMKKSDLEKFIDNSLETNNILLTNLQRASELISSFKKIAVDQSSEDKTQIELISYTKDIITTLAPKFKNTDYNIEILGDNTQLHTYAGDFSQVITNLIINSIIHGFNNSNSGNIKIEIKDNLDKVIIIYSDDGKGIPKENISKIFDPFFTTNRENGGSGLGLNIIYNIVTTKLNGTIVCDSETGNGTKFIIQINR